MLLSNCGVPNYNLCHSHGLKCLLETIPLHSPLKGRQNVFFFFFFCLLDSIVSSCSFALIHVKIIRHDSDYFSCNVFNLLDALIKSGLDPFLQLKCCKGRVISKCCICQTFIRGRIKNPATRFMNRVSSGVVLCRDHFPAKKRRT